MLQPTETHRQQGFLVECNLHTYTHLAKDLLLYLSGHGNSLLQAQQNTHIVTCT